MNAAGTHRKTRCRLLKTACFLAFFWMATVRLVPSLEDRDADPYILELVLEINLARSRPGEYAERLQALLPHFIDRTLHLPGEPPLLTAEGVAAVQEAIDFLNQTTPRPPLSLSGGMTRAAEAHVVDLATRGITGHRGSDGSRVGDRIGRFGEWGLRSGENLSYGRRSPARLVISQLIDDGVATRGHRKNLLHPDYRFIGVAHGPHPTKGHVTVLTFADAYSEEASSSVAGFENPALLRRQD